jgi:hypothetical protein
MGIVNSKKKHKVLKPKVASAQSHSSTNITIESTTSFSTNGTRNTKQVQTIQTNTKQTGYQANSINDIPNRYSSAAKISLNEDTIKSSGISSDISAHSHSIKNDYSDESNSFYLPKDWDRVDTPYNVRNVFSFVYCL